MKNEEKFKNLGTEWKTKNAKNLWDIIKAILRKLNKTKCLYQKFERAWTNNLMMHLKALEI